MSEEIKSLIEQQGKAFYAFKQTHEELKKNDVVTAGKLERIEKSLDAAVEAKNAIEAKLAAEVKEREELELRLSKVGNSEKNDAIALELKDFNNYIAGKGAFSEAEYTDYKSAFGVFLRKNASLLTGDQLKAMSVGSDADGGYLVPPDTSGRIVKKIYETSPMRQIASVTTISTDSLEGIEDLGEGSAGWVGETQSRADTDTPQIGKWKIEAFEIYSQPKVTQKLLDDASVNVEAWLAEKTGDKIARVENAAFITGNGMGKPRGLTSYATVADTGSGVAWGSIGHVASGVAGAFPTSNPADKLFDLVGALKDAYLPGARFLTRRSLVTAIRKFKDGTGNYLWQPSLVAGQPETILGYPLVRYEDIPALADGSLSMWFGNFQQAYQIIDRIGIRILRDPYTDKPYVKFYTTKRTGGGVVNFEAVKAMKFATS